MAFRWPREAWRLFRRLQPGSARRPKPKPTYAEHLKDREAELVKQGYKIMRASKRREWTDEKSTIEVTQSTSKTFDAKKQGNLSTAAVFELKDTGSGGGFALAAEVIYLGETTTKMYAPSCGCGGEPKMTTSASVVAYM
jgi:hypothetical protein